MRVHIASATFMSVEVVGRSSHDKATVARMQRLAVFAAMTNSLKIGGLNIECACFAP